MYLDPDNKQSYSQHLLLLTFQNYYERKINFTLQSVKVTSVIIPAL